MKKLFIFSRNIYIFIHFLGELFVHSWYFKFIPVIDQTVPWVPEPRQQNEAKSKRILIVLAGQKNR